MDVHIDKCIDTIKGGSRHAEKSRKVLLMMKAVKLGQELEQGRSRNMVGAGLEQVGMSRAGVGEGAGAGQEGGRGRSMSRAGAGLDQEQGQGRAGAGHK